MKILIWKALCIFLTSTLLTGIAHAVLIDFEGLAGMNNTPGTAIPMEAQISDQFLATDGVLFSSPGSPFIAAVNLGTGHATSGVIGVGGATIAGALTYTANFLNARFFDPTNPLKPAVTDSVSVRTDLLAINQLLKLEAFDINGNLIWTDEQVDTGGTLFSASVNGIHSISFFGATTTALDDFSFNTVTPATVPVPAAAWLFGTGLLGLLSFGKKH